MAVALEYASPGQRNGALKYFYPGKPECWEILNNDETTKAVLVVRCPNDRMSEIFVFTESADFQVTNASEYLDNKRDCRWFISSDNPVHEMDFAVNSPTPYSLVFEHMVSMSSN